MILHIYADYEKRLGAYKVAYVLKRDYGINISVGRVYRLMDKLELPKMSTDKPGQRRRSKEPSGLENHLSQAFSQKAPDIVWASDFTYLKAGGRWYYLCIVMDLFSRKIISRHLSPKADADLVMTAFKLAYAKRNAPYGLMFHSDRGSQYTAFSFRRLLDSLNVVRSFSKKAIPLTMPAVSASSNISKRKRLTGGYIIPLLNLDLLSSGTLTVTIIQGGLIRP